LLIRFFLNRPYTKVSWQNYPRAALITLEWSRVDETTVVGRVTAAADFQVVLETYIPSAASTWGLPAVYSLADSKQAIKGKQYFDKVFGSASQFVVMVDRPNTGSGTYPSLEQLHDSMRGAGVLVNSIDSDRSKNAAGLQFVTDASHTAHFVAALGWDQKELLTKAQGWLTPDKMIPSAGVVVRN
jgi:hypothetical protein